jgi:hypothetical protein
LGAKDADEPLEDALVADELEGPFVLAKLASAIHVGATSLPRPGPRMLNQTLRVLGRHEFNEVAAANLQNEIDKAFEFVGRSQGQMALEEDTVEAVQSANDEAGELDQKGPSCVQGILPRLVEQDTDQFGR